MQYPYWWRTSFYTWHLKSQSTLPGPSRTGVFRAEQMFFKSVCSVCDFVWLWGKVPLWHHFRCIVSVICVSMHSHVSWHGRYYFQCTSSHICILKATFLEKQGASGTLQNETLWHVTMKQIRNKVLTYCEILRYINTYVCESIFFNVRVTNQVLFQTIFPKASPTYMRQVVNPRHHQTPQWQSVAKHWISL